MFGRDYRRLSSCKTIAVLDSACSVDALDSAEISRHHARAQRRRMSAVWPYSIPGPFDERAVDLPGSGGDIACFGGHVGVLPPTPGFRLCVDRAS